MSAEKLQVEVEKADPEKRRFAFRKMMAAWETVHLPASKVTIEWHRSIRDGVVDSSGDFETEDPEVAEELRKVAAAGPLLRIFEQE